jgi:hypothetical protein
VVDSRFFFFFSICLFFIHISTGEASVRYKTSFGQCPSRSAGKLTIKLVGEFDKTKSLRKLKSMIVKGKLSEKHFLSGYNINFNPVENVLGIGLECPTPLMKVQITRNDGESFLYSILVEDGDLVDPTYEAILRAEKKISVDLPNLSISEDFITKDKLKFLSSKVLQSMSVGVKTKLAEIIISDEEDLTAILSIKNRPVSVFMGKREWNKKTKKLNKVLSFLEKKRKIPSVINITNSEKIVVKFSN